MPKGVYDRSTRWRPLADRFAEAYSINEATGCWDWTHGRSRFGHGNICRGGYGRDGKTKLLAHRVSYELHRGPIPEGLLVLHKCDVPGCVNPDHLFLGTKADNSADMVGKGRQRRGADLPQTRLTADSVRAIRQSAALTQREIATLHGVSEATVWKVLHNKTWKGV